MSAAHDVALVPAEALSRRRRAVTLSIKRLSKREMAVGAMAYPEPTARPRTRAACPPDAAECAHVSCAMHLALDVHPLTGSIKINVPFTHDADGMPDLDLDALPHRCALAAAEAGGMTLEDVGAAMNLTHERIRQLEDLALAKLRCAPLTGILEEFVERPAHWIAPTPTPPATPPIPMEAPVKSDAPTSAAPTCAWSESPCDNPVGVVRRNTRLPDLCPRHRVVARGRERNAAARTKASKPGAAARTVGQRIVAAPAPPGSTVEQVVRALRVVEQLGGVERAERIAAAMGAT